MDWVELQKGGERVFLPLPLVPLVNFLFNPQAAEIIEASKGALRRALAENRQNLIALDRWADDGGPCP